MTTVRPASLLTVTAAVFAVAAGITAPPAAATETAESASSATAESGAGSSAGSTAALETSAATQATSATADSAASETPAASEAPTASETAAAPATSTSPETAAVATTEAAPADVATADPIETEDIARLKGDLNAHDPALVKGANGKPWYVFSTGDASIGGGAIQIRSSKNGRNWSFAGTVWDKIPDWLTKTVPGATYLWAPEIYKHDGVYYLYYSASTWGKNNSVIALATNTTLDPTDPDYNWVDRGKVLRSMPTSDFNAIDAGIVEDGDGTPWLAFGSYWSGIHMVQLEWPSGLRADTKKPLRIADRKVAPNAVEASYIVPQDGWYYLFTSWGQCCEGAKSDYKIAVGRSRDVTGPYVDRNGRALLDGGGTILQDTSGDRVGPGGQSVSNNVMAYHYYDASADGATKLALKRIYWGDDGWPELDGDKK
jgi:arabinan endo-1,5-alpha-L-arabinosidase